MLGARREWGSLVVISAAAAFSALARGERESPHDRPWRGELSPAPLLRSLSWSPEWALKAPPRDPATSRADPAFALALRRPPPPAAGASARGAAVRSRLPTCPHLGARRLPHGHPWNHIYYLPEYEPPSGDLFSILLRKDCAKWAGAGRQDGRTATSYLPSTSPSRPRPRDSKVCIAVSPSEARAGDLARAGCRSDPSGLRRGIPLIMVDIGSGTAE